MYQNLHTIKFVFLCGGSGMQASTTTGKMASGAVIV